MKGMEKYVCIFRYKFNPGFPDETYKELSDMLNEDVKDFEGFIKVEDYPGVSISYWTSMKAIREWGSYYAHEVAKEYGKHDAYQWYDYEIFKSI